METIEINGINVQVLASGIKKYGYENLIEISCYPHVVNYTRNGMETEDWQVLETEDIKLFMNNMDGYLIIIEFEKSHYEEHKGIVVDKPGHVYYTIF